MEFRTTFFKIKILYRTNDKNNREVSPVQHLTGYTSLIKIIIPSGQNYVKSNKNSKFNVTIEKI